MPSSHYLSAKLQKRFKSAVSQGCNVPINDVKIEKIRSKEHDAFKKNVMSQSYITKMPVSIYTPNKAKAQKVINTLTTPRMLSMIEIAIDMRALIQASDDDAPSKNIKFAVYGTPRIEQTQLALKIAEQKIAQQKLKAAKVIAARRAVAKAAQEARAIMAAQQAQLAKQAQQKALDSKKEATLALISSMGTHKKTAATKNVSAAPAHKRAIDKHDLSSVLNIRNALHGVSPTPAATHHMARSKTKHKLTQPKKTVVPENDAKIYAVVCVVFFALAVAAAIAFLPSSDSTKSEEAVDLDSIAEKVALKPAADPTGLGNETYSLIGAELDDTELAISKGSDSDEGI